MNPRPLVSISLALLPLVFAHPTDGQTDTKPLPKAEIVGLETVTTQAFSDIVKEKCDGKY